MLHSRLPDRTRHVEMYREPCLDLDDLRFDLASRNETDPDNQTNGIRRKSARLKPKILPLRHSGEV
jgi:hypothetical protein